MRVGVCSPSGRRSVRPGPRPAARLLKARAGFPGRGSAEPAPLPSDSLWGAHADAPDEPGCGSRGEGRGGGAEAGGGGGRAAAVGAPPSASPSALGRGPRGKTWPQPRRPGRIGRMRERRREAWRCSFPSLGTQQQVAAWPVEARRPQARGNGPGRVGRAASVALGARECVTRSHARGIHGDLRTGVKEEIPLSLVSLPPSWTFAPVMAVSSSWKPRSCSSCSELLLPSEKGRLGQLCSWDQTTTTASPPWPLVMLPHPTSHVPSPALGAL